MIDSLIFPAPKCRYSIRDFNGNLFHIPRIDHDTIGEFIKAPDPRPYPRRVLLYCHANAAEIGDLTTEMEYLSAAFEMDVLTVEYTGYGLVGSTASEDEVYEDVYAAYRFLTVHMKYSPLNVVVYGRSIGTGPATMLASQKPIGGLILLTPFTCIKDCVYNFAGSLASGLVGNRFSNISLIPHVKVPVLIIHGTNDEIVPYDHGQKLNDACPSSILHTLVGYGHNNIPYTKVAEVVQEYLKSSLPPPVPDSAVETPPVEYKARLKLPPLYDIPDLRVALENSVDHEVLVTVIYNNVLEFVALVEVLQGYAKEEAVKDGGKPMTPGALLDLAVMVWGAPWVEVMVAVTNESSEFYTFMDAALRYQALREKLEQWKQQESPLPMLYRWGLPVLNITPNRTFRNAMVHAVQYGMSPKARDMIQISIERYVRLLPTDVSARVASCRTHKPCVLPPCFNSYLSLAIDQGLLEPLSTPEGQTITADVAYCNALMLASLGHMSVSALEELPNVLQKYQSAMQGNVYLPIRNEPLAHGRPKGNGDCCVM